MNTFLPLRRLAALLVLAASGVALAAVETPATQIGVTTVSAQEARGLIDKGARAVDVRSPHDFLSGHVPGAIHAIYREHSVQRIDFDPTADDVPAFLNRLHRKIPDPGTAIVMYCNGVHCWKSYKALRAAADNGYRRLYWLRGGLSEWRQAGLPIVTERGK